MKGTGSAFCGMSRRLLTTALSTFPNDNPNYLVLTVYGMRPKRT